MLSLTQKREALYQGKTLKDIPMKVVYYARVSTEKEEQLNSLENQKKYFEELINENENWSLVGCYIDEGISGTSVKKRQSFLKMLEDAKKEKFDLILTKEVSRFARNTIDSISYTQELLNRGVIVYFINDNINTIYPDSEFRLTLMSSLAQDEVRRLSERVKFGFKRSMKDGKVLGGGNIIGYTKEKGKLEIHPKQAEMVKLLFRLYATGNYSFQKIADILWQEKYYNTKGEKYSPRVLSRIIENPKYKGYYCGNRTHVESYKTHQKVTNPKEEWIVYKDEKIPVIVDEELWEKANAVYRCKKQLKKNKSPRNNYKEGSYHGILKCTYDGCNYTRLSSGKRKQNPVWVCSAYLQKGKKVCESPIIKESLLEKKVIEWIKAKINLDGHQKEEVFKSYYRALTDQNYQIVLKEQIEKNKNKKENVMELLVEKLITLEEGRKKMQELNDKINFLSHQLKKKKEEKKDQYQALYQRIETYFQEDLVKDAIPLLLKEIKVEKVESRRNIIKLNILLNSKKQDELFINLEEGV